MNNKISVIIPAYNEEKSIGGVIDDTTKVLKANQYDFEIIVVDDASKDKTAEIVKNKNVRVITHRVNKGVGAARKTGILNSKGDIIVMLDADGTYPAVSIPELLRFMPEFDQVIGCRKKEQGSFRILRQPAKWILFKLASFLVKQKIPDLNSGFRALKKDILLKYLYLIPNGFSCVSTMTLAFLCNDHNVKYVPIDYYRRIGKSKFKMFVDTRDFLFTIIRIIMYFNPLRIFLPLSLLILTFGIVKAIYDVFLSKIGHMQESDSVILVSATIVLSLGLLADLIVTQEKNRRMCNTLKGEE
jgi:glycosyltransferase involved in cell wall biosynthesis